jgi:hypothetical protein
MNYRKVKLAGGVEVYFDLDARPTKCKKCGESIRFAATLTGKKMPVSEIAPGEYQSHFADCPFADGFRKGQKKDDVYDRIEAEKRNQDYINSL